MAGLKVASTSASKIEGHSMFYPQEKGDNSTFWSGWDNSGKPGKMGGFAGKDRGFKEGRKGGMKEFGGGKKEGGSCPFCS